MRNIFVLLFFFLLFVSCNKSIDCNDVFEKKSIDNEFEISTDEFVKGFLIDNPNTNFSLKCLFNSKGKNIKNMFVIDSIENRYTLKIKDEYSINFSSKDSIYCLFWDSRKYMMNYATKNYIKIRISDKREPCDSIKEIIYTSISEKIKKITKEHVKLVDLYDKVLDNKIYKYLNSLNSIQKKELIKCKKTYKLLDWIENSKEYGFQNRKYELTPEIKHFLKIIVEIVTEKTENELWKHKNFSINIIGYADQRAFGSSVRISKDDFGFLLKNKPKIFINNCNLNNDFVIINKKSEYNITSINNNCELSWLRAFSSTLFLKNEFDKKNLKNIIQFKYKGGNVSYGGDFDVNRKIEVQIELKAGSE